MTRRFMSAIAVIALLAGAGLLVGTTSAPAQTIGGLTCTPPSVVAGGSVSISGSGFTPSSTVIVTLETNPIGATSVATLATLEADGSGNIAATVTIPLGTPTGSYQILAVAEDGTSYEVSLACADPGITVVLTTAVTPSKFTG